MDDMIKPGSTPRPRRQDICLEALGKDPSATQHCVTVEPACGNNQSHSLSRDGQICQAAMITTVYPLRSCSAAWTTAAHIRRADSEYYCVASRSCLIDYKASRHECGGAKRMNHDADSFCKTNASRRPELIKSESEPIFHAETQRAVWHWRPEAHACLVAPIIGWAAAQRKMSILHANATFTIVAVSRLERHLFF